MSSYDQIFSELKSMDLKLSKFVSGMISGPLVIFSGWHEHPHDLLMKIVTFWVLISLNVCVILKICQNRRNIPGLDLQNLRSILSSLTSQHSDALSFLCPRPLDAEISEGDTFTQNQGPKL